ARMAHIAYFSTYRRSSSGSCRATYTAPSPKPTTSELGLSVALPTSRPFDQMSYVRTLSLAGLVRHTHTSPLGVTATPLLIPIDVNAAMVPGKSEAGMAGSSPPELPPVLMLVAPPGPTRIVIRGALAWAARKASRSALPMRIGV